MAIQEQLNIREGRPSVFATEARAPPVVHDHIAQQVFTDEPPEGPGGVRGLFRYVVNLVVSVCYSTITSVLNLLLSFVRNDDRRCKYNSLFFSSCYLCFNNNMGVQEVPYNCLSISVVLFLKYVVW